MLNVSNINKLKITNVNNITYSPYLLSKKKKKTYSPYLLPCLDTKFLTSIKNINL